MYAYQKCPFGAHKRGLRGMFQEIQKQRILEGPQNQILPGIKCGFKMENMDQDNLKMKKWQIF